MSQIGSGVSLRGFVDEDAQFTFNLDSAIVIGDVGKAVELDASAPNQVKLASDGGIVFGMLMTVEDRASNEGVKVGTVALRGFFALPQAASQSFVVGSSIKGGGAGTVKLLAVSLDTDGSGTPAELLTSHNWRARVVEVNGSTDVVVAFV